MTPHLGDLASALVDGQLGDDAAAAATGHLEACPACAADVRAVAEIRALVRGLAPVEPRRPLVAATAPARATGLVAAAAAVAALLALAGVERDRPPAPAVASLVQVHSTAPVNVDPMSQLAPAAIPVSFGR